MTSEIKTRRLIITLPDTTGEEADATASRIEKHLNTRHAEYDNATVTHALGESLPVGLTARVVENRIIVRDVGTSLDSVARLNLSALEARQLAGVLIAHAEELETVRTECRHCGRIVTLSQGRWVDPEATGDDSVWRETCDANDTERAAPHES